MGKKSKKISKKKKVDDGDLEESDSRTKSGPAPAMVTAMINMFPPY